jgi:hypothetical protein
VSKAHLKSTLNVGVVVVGVLSILTSLTLLTFALLHAGGAQ